MSPFLMPQNVPVFDAQNVPVFDAALRVLS